MCCRPSNTSGTCLNRYFEPPHALNHFRFPFYTCCTFKMDYRSITSRKLRYTNTWPSSVFAIVGIISVATVTMATSAEATGTLKVECDFGSLQFKNYTFSLTKGALMAHFGDARSCKIGHNASLAIVRVGLSGLKENISVIYAVVMEKLEVSYVGTAHYQDVMFGDGYKFHACPVSHHQHQNTELNLFLFGAPDNATFQLSVELDDTFLSSGETKAVPLQQSDSQGQVLAFDVHQDSLYKLLQISASSNDDTECNLVVSRSCFQVQRQVKSSGNSDKQMTLSFTRFGRITLSQFSSPKIETGRWYIGVLIRQVKPGSAVKKTVNITITQSYQYDSIGKSRPAAYMCLIAWSMGIAIAVFAHFFLNSDFDEMAPPHVNEDHLTANLDTTVSDYIPLPIPWRTFPCKRWAEVVTVRWFSKGMKTFSYLTAVLAVAFLVGSAQFVIGRWSSMITSGDRDSCYYNERCYRPIALADLPSNLMVSNVPYVIHGVILALSFSFREAIALDFFKHKHTLDIKHLFVPYDYSIAYALSWALIFEGIFSATYHLCPTRLTFQFDSAFMFIISGLVVIAMYNSRIKKVVDTSIDEPQFHESDNRPPDQTIVQAPKYFLFFVAPLLVLNYVGSVRDTAGLPSFVEGVFWAFLVIWMLLLYLWAFKKIGAPCGRGVRCFSSAEDRLKWFWLILFPICLILIGVSKFGDWSQFFLFACVAAVALSIMGLMTLNMVLSVKRYRSPDAVDGRHPLCDRKAVCKSFLYNAHRVFFIFALFLLWVFAMYFFKLKPTTKKTAAPSISRTFNHDCVLWDFFGYHDIWHMLSSFALLMSAYFLVYMCRKVEKYYWVEANYSKNKYRSTKQGGHEQSSDEAAVVDVHVV